MPSHVGQARFSGCIAFTGWPRDRLEALLPPELEPDDDGASRGGHPVVFVFGEQADGAFLFGGFTIPLGVRYQELGIVVPVRHRHARGPHIFVPRMYASYFPAVWNGNAHYGYGKELAELGWHGRVYVVTGREGAPLLRVATERAGPWTAAEREPGGFDRVRELATRPVLGRKADGTWVTSTFDWDFRAARVRRSDCSVSIDAPLVPGCPTGRYPDVAPGSFEVREMVWRVSWPVESRF